MAKYDVELITDKHGKPMPQYFDEVEQKMKPITKDNFDGTINGSVDVEFPDVQKVEVTNPTEFPAELNVNVNNPVDTVSVDNLPDVQRVEVTNAQTQMDVNVLNPVDSISVENLPIDYPDSAVKAELELIKQQQADILDKLNDTIDTRLTGSNVGQKTFSKYIPITLEPGQSLDIRVYADVGETWRVIHGHVELFPSIDATEGDKSILLNPGNRYMSVSMGLRAEGSPNSYLHILSNANERNRYWFGNLIMRDDSGFMIRASNNTDGTIKNVFYSLSVEVINNEN